MTQKHLSWGVILEQSIAVIDGQNAIQLTRIKQKILFSSARDTRKANLDSFVPLGVVRVTEHETLEVRLFRFAAPNTDAVLQRNQLET